MWDTRPVPLVVHLPSELADDIEEVRDRDPEFLGRAIQYALARRIIFDELKNSMDLGTGSGGGGVPAPQH